MRSHLRHAVAGLLLAALLSAACGQKDGVHVALPSTQDTAMAPPALGASFSDDDGDGLDDTTGLSQTAYVDEVGGAPAEQNGGTRVATQDTDATSDATGGPSPDGTNDKTPQDDRNRDGDERAPADPRDKTGITASTIKIGMHVPLTGAAPLPASSIKTGSDQYWRAGYKVAGRTVEVVLRDDKYNPSAASQVCQELIAEDVFLLFGTGGTDQMAECARVADRAGVPYVSVGATEAGLDELERYFSLSMSYARQMPLLMQYISKTVKPANKKIAIIASDTANFDDAVKAYEQAAGDTGLTPHVYRPSKQPSDAELAALAQHIARDQISVGTPVMAPTQWVKLASNPQLRALDWHGVGLTKGLNTVAAAVCQGSGGAVDGATFFSPWPGLNMADAIDPAFNAKGGGGDDLQWGLWGLNKSLHVAMSNMGDDPSRSAFLRAMTQPMRSGIYPSLAHTPSDHFRAQEVHQLRLDCNARQYVSTRSTIFRRSF